MFRTSNCSFSERIVRAVLWYFFHAGSCHRPDCLYGYHKTAYTYKSFWRWKLGCAKYVEDTI